MESKFCTEPIKSYQRTASENTDDSIEQHLFHYYPTLNDIQRRDPSYRVWRRCVVIEALRRGIITKDPGPNSAPERA